VAITAYVLTLAVLIPVSGWLAEPVSAPARVPHRRRDLHPRLDRLRGRRRPDDPDATRVVQGMGGA
jgi:hypothetical protein